MQHLQDLEDRYNRLRLEVQLAADKGEAAGESELIRRAMAKEKSANPVKGFFGASRSKTSKHSHVPAFCITQMYLKQLWLRTRLPTLP